MPAPATGEEAGSPARTVAHAALISAVLAALGSILGLGRDLLVASLFGANRDTDAFLVAWTVPETLAPLLIEGTMAFVMVPAFGRAIVAAQLRRANNRALGFPVGADPVAELVEATLPRLVVGLTLIGILLGVGAPWVVPALAPGLADPALAVRCMQVVAVTVPLLGIAGYLAAALRTHERFGPPAAIYVAYNVGIIGSILLLWRSLGVVAAAIGIAVGTALMVGVQAPSAVRVLPRLRTVGLRRRSTLFAFAALVPVAAYTLTRQAQTFVERYAAAPLVEGTISHLNYAQKIAQIPVTLSFMAAAVTFPIFAKSVAAGRSDEARRRMEVDLVVVGTVALLAAAYFWVFGPSVVATLYQHGAFTAADTAATAAILRVYVLGLIGQALVNLLVRPYFTFEGQVWFPALAMTAGLLLTGVATFLLVGPYGPLGIAAANALGILLTALLLVTGSRRRLSVAPGRAAYLRLALMLVPLALAVAVGVGVHGLLAGVPAPVEAVAGGLAMLVPLAAAALVARRARAGGAA